MQLPVHDMAGKVISEADLPTGIFQAKVNVGLMHQALVRQLAGERAGTHKGKTRGEVAYSTRKIYRQKGTGNARHGSKKAPIFVGGGRAHPVRVRDYSKKMPRKMRRAAIRSALTVKAADGNLVLVDQIAMDAPKTKSFLQFVNTVAGDASALVVIAEENFTVERSARNLTDVKALRYMLLNIKDLLGHDKLILSVDALEAIKAWLATEKQVEATGYDPSDYVVPEKPVKEKPVKVTQPPAVEAAPEPEPAVEVQAEVEEVVEAVTEPAAEAAPEVEAAPAVTVESGEPDDLKKIEGIGPKIAKTLVGEGVTTFAQLAAMTPEAISELLAGKVRAFGTDTWPEQAQLAADGKWDELKALQDELQGGRRPTD